MVHCIGSAMAYTETTSRGWFGRIGDSLKGMIFGLLLIPASLILLVCNERNAVADIRANEEIGANVQSVPADQVSAANEGRLVHTKGQAETGDVLTNEAFGIAENAIHLTWKAEIYQWEESSTRETRKKLGGGEETVTTYHYKHVWSDDPIDSSGFKEKGHENPKSRQFSSGSQQASKVMLGAFQLPDGLVSQIRTQQALPLAKIPAALSERGRLANGVFHTGDPASPKVGDEKVSFHVTRPGPVSVMAVQNGNTFTPYTATNGKQKFLLYEGLLSAEEIVKGEENKAMLMRWILRTAGTFLLWMALALLSKPLSMVADVVPLFGSLVGFLTGAVSLLLSAGISFAVIAVSWIAFRPVLGIGLLVGAAACIIFMWIMQKKRAAA